jgi:NAD(P)-dependent dehydrogenase (short-subunit alcohol dehydrogenase family)
MRQHWATAEEVTESVDLSNKTALVTGSSSGIGLETLRVLALRGADVIAVARTKDKAERVRAFVMRPGARGTMSTFECEQTDFDSVVACADAIRSLGKPMDILICNAGLNAPRLERVNGVEKTFAVHHLSHLILVNRLLDRVKAAPQGRVVVVSSVMYKDAPRVGIEFDNLSGERRYDWRRMYGQSKLANGLFIREPSRTLIGTGATANVLHPGNAEGTNIGHIWNKETIPFQWRVFGWFLSPLWLLRRGGLRLKTTAQGAATTCYVATNPALTHVSGAYFEIAGSQHRAATCVTTTWRRRFGMSPKTSLDSTSVDLYLPRIPMASRLKPCTFC